MNKLKNHLVANTNLYLFATYAIFSIVVAGTYYKYSAVRTAVYKNAVATELQNTIRNQDKLFDALINNLKK